MLFLGGGGVSLGERSAFALVPHSVPEIEVARHGSDRRQYWDSVKEVLDRLEGARIIVDIYEEYVFVG